MASNKDYSNHIVGGAILIIVILVGVFFATQNSGTSTVGGNVTNEEARENTSNTGISFDVADQAAGDSVMVTGIQVSSESWIAVRDADALRVLGAVRVAPSTQSITVPLLRNTVAGKGYQVVVYYDDGDRVFDMKKDTLAATVGGSFNAQ